MSVERSSSREPGKREYDSLLATAASFFEAHDYDQVVLLVEEIPRHERSPAAQRLLRRASQLADEVADLKVRIDDMVAGGRFKNLKECLERLVEIRPGLKRYEGYLQAINTYRHGAAYKVLRAPDGSVRFDPAGSEWTAGTIALLVLLPLLIFGGLYFAVRAYLANGDPGWTVLTVEVDDATAEVAIDDHVLSPLDLGTQMEVAVGEHDAIVRRTGREVWRQRFRAAAGRRTVLRIRLSGPEPVADVSTEDGDSAAAVAVAEPKQPDPQPTVDPPAEPEPTPEAPIAGTPAATPPPSNLPPPPAVSNDPRYNSGFVATGIDPDGMAITFRALGVRESRKHVTPLTPDHDSPTFLVPPGAFPPGPRDADRSAAEWLHANTKCELTLMTPDGLLHSRFSRSVSDRYKPDPPLPNSPYAVLGIRILDKPMGRADLAMLQGLTELQEIEFDLANSAGDEFAGFENLAASARLRSVIVEGNGAPRDLSPLRHFPQLERLHVTCNKLSPGSYEVVGSLRELRRVMLRNMAGAGPQQFQSLSRLTKLQWMRLTGLEFDPVVATHLAQLRDLERLDIIGQGRFSSQAVAPLATLPKLRDLTLRERSVDADAYQHVARMQNLVKLSVNGLADSDVAQLAGLPRLETISGSTPRITDGAIPILVGMPALKGVFLTGANLSPGARASFKTQRPDVRSSL